MVNPSNNLKNSTIRKFNAVLYLLLGLASTVFLLLPFVFRFTPFIQVGELFDEAKTDLSDFQQITASHSFSPVHPDAEES